jgi:putative transposase
MLKGSASRASGVARLMRAAGRVGRPARRFQRTTVADPQVQAEDLVQRRFEATAPEQLWFGDITSVRTWQGWLRVVQINDLTSVTTEVVAVAGEGLVIGPV